MVIIFLQEAKKSKNGKAPHTAWCNYDDLNEYFWYLRIQVEQCISCLRLKHAVIACIFFFLLLHIIIWLTLPRSSDCFSLGWPMRDDGEFFKSTRDTSKVHSHYFCINCFIWMTIFLITLYDCYPRAKELLTKILQGWVNRILPRPDHFGIPFEVLTASGHSSCLLYR